MRRLALCGGGTGGHIYPALALGEAFLAGGEGREVLFLGSNRGLEARLVPAAGLPFLALPARGFRGKPPLQKLLALWDLARGFWVALAALRRFRPDALIATGSFASLPPLLAARLTGLPYFIQEQNSVPGRVNALLSGGARCLFLAYPEAGERMSARPPRLISGNPLRRALVERAGRRRLEGPPPRPLRLLAFGGSRGARSLNRAIADALPRLVGRFDFRALIQTGAADLEATRAALAALGPAVEVRAYVENMPEEMAGSHWVICRSGAMTLSEITLMGLPALLVPYPHAVDDHQTRNAAALAAAGAARVLDDETLDGEALAATLAALWEEEGLEARMAAASAALGRPDAAAAILAAAEKSLVAPKNR